MLPVLTMRPIILLSSTFPLLLHIQAMGGGQVLPIGPSPCEESSWVGHMDGPVLQG